MIRPLKKNETIMKKIFTFILAIGLSFPILAQAEKKVIIEHFTNTRCGTCASKNPAFYEVLVDYPDVLHIAYHPSSPYSSCVFNQYNPTENDNRAYFYDAYGGTPRGVIQGNVLPFQNPIVKPEQIEAELGGSSDYDVYITKTKLSDTDYKIRLEIERVSGSEVETIKVYSGLAEEEVAYNAPNGEDMHYDVFRKVIFFDTVNLNSIGQKKVIEYEYSTDDEWVEEQIYAYAIIHDNATNAIKQAGSSLTTVSAVGEKKVSELSSIFYPNPSSGIVKIKSEYNGDFIKFELYNIVGKKVREFSNTNEMNIADLKEGYYFVRMTDKNQDVFSTRIVKSN